MTDDRCDMITDACKNVCLGTTKKVDFTEIDIETIQTSDSNLTIDVAVVFLRHIDDGSYVEASIATAKAQITNAKSRRHAKVHRLCLGIIDTAL